MFSIFFYYILKVSHGIKRGNANTIIGHLTMLINYYVLIEHHSLAESSRHVMVLSIYIRHLKRLSSRILE